MTTHPYHPGKALLPDLHMTLNIFVFNKFPFGVLKLSCTLSYLLASTYPLISTSSHVHDIQQSQRPSAVKIIRFKRELVILLVQEALTTAEVI